MRMLEDVNKESVMNVFVGDVCVLPERYRVFTASLQDMVTNVHIVGLGLWHSGCRRCGTAQYMLSSGSQTKVLRH